MASVTLQPQSVTDSLVQQIKSYSDLSGTSASTAATAAVNAQNSQQQAATSETNAAASATSAAQSAAQASALLNQYITTIGNGTLTTFTITHNLNIQYPTIKIIEISSGNYVYPPCFMDGPQLTVTNSNVVTIVFSTAPTSGQYKVIIQG